MERLRHMLSAAEAIGRYVERGRTAFESDPALRDAIVYQIVVLGEAAKAVVAADPSLEIDLPQVEWSLLAKLRDKVTHQYWAINQEIVWATAAQDIATIRGLLRGAIEQLG